jgi:hypothetical protein
MLVLELARCEWDCRNFCARGHDDGNGKDHCMRLMRQMGLKGVVHGKSDQGRHRHLVELSRPGRPAAQKKSAHASEQERSDILRRRRAWFEGQHDLDPATLVFIDETGLSTKGPPLSGKSPPQV